MRRKMKIAGKSNWFRPDSKREKKLGNGTVDNQGQDNGRVVGRSLGGGSQKAVVGVPKVTQTTTRKPEDVHIAAPLFVQATEGGNLASLLRVEEEKLGVILGWKFKIVERGGTMLRQLLTKANIFSGEPCGRSRCGACTSMEKPQNCRRRGILYETTCTECMVEGQPTARYVGESARSAAERKKEHLDDAKSKSKDSHMWKHWVNHHGGVETPFQFKILSFFSSPLERQVGEAVRILRTGAEQILNSKSENNRCKIPRIIAKDGREEMTLGDKEQQDENTIWEDVKQGGIFLGSLGASLPRNL